MSDLKKILSKDMRVRYTKRLAYIIRPITVFTKYTCMKLTDKNAEKIFYQFFDVRDFHA